MFFFSQRTFVNNRKDNHDFPDSSKASAPGIVYTLENRDAMKKPTDKSIVPPPEGHSTGGIPPSNQPVAPPPVHPEATARPPADPSPLNQLQMGASPVANASTRATPPNKKPPTAAASALTTAKQPSEDDSEEAQKEHWFSRWLMDAPSWLVSTLVHVTIILLLALIPMRDQVQNSLSILLGMSDGGGNNEELTSFELADSAMDMQSESDLGEDMSLIATELDPSITEIPNLDGDLTLSNLSLKSGLSSRSGLMKDALLKAYGGTSETERAVALGLEWLKRQQSSDGSWSLAGPYSEGGVNENRSAATALALLAFMGAGNTHLAGNHQNVVQRGLDYLLGLQDDDGFFAAKATGIQRTYSQAQASIAICELYGMTGDEKLLKPARLAVQYAIQAQGDLGGWRYQPRDDGDTSVTGWYVMALISARMAGIDVSSDALEKVHKFLDSVQRKPGTRGQDPDGELYAYLPTSAAKDSMTAEGMLCRMYLGWRTNDPRIQKGCEFLNGRPISIEITDRDYYYWYYATNALHHAGGSAWTKWNDAMKTSLPALQVQTGRERGSWPPQGDPHGDAGGRLYSTVLAVLCLEAYYRHMPLSEIANK